MRMHGRTERAERTSGEGCEAGDSGHIAREMEQLSEEGWDRTEHLVMLVVSDDHADSWR